MNKLYLLSLLFIIFTVLSCSDASANKNISGITKIIITNKTDYKVKHIYYKQTSNFTSDNGYGIELLNTSVLEDKEKLIICPDFISKNEELPYYFTFVRQKGSSSNELYITTDKPIYLSTESGLVNIDLLPYNFYSTISDNLEKTCNDGKNGQ